MKVLSYHENTETFIFIIAVLLLTNIAVLAYFLWIKQPEQNTWRREPKECGIADRLKDSVGFNDEQVAQYEKLKDDQWTHYTTHV